jgi:hypothetical protein
MVWPAAAAAEPARSLAPVWPAGRAALPVKSVALVQAWVPGPQLAVSEVLLAVTAALVDR